VIRVRNMPFRVLGVLAPKGQGQWGQDQDDFVLAPWTTVQKKLLGITYIQQVSITARTSELVEPTAIAITRLMRARHRIPNPRATTSACARSRRWPRRACRWPRR
jgi:putative ABC transport system permease protein